MKIHWKALIASLALSLGTGFFSTILSPNMKETYEALYKPPLAPPGWLFPVVWSLLYILIGLASYLVATSANEEREQALRLYLTQLVFNLGWTVIFFRFHAYLTAFLILIVLWMMVLRLIKYYRKIDELAGLMLIPYLLWMTYAAYLNLAIALYYLS